jgi:CelD/BcsL family acetyltransferase involved in cellulose biosynthesis
VVTDLDEFEELAPEWDGLAVAAGNVFLTTAWLSAWWRSYGRGALVVVVVRGSTGKLLAGVPVARSARTVWTSPTNWESGGWGVAAADETARRLAWRALADLAPGRLRLQFLIDDAASAAEEFAAAGYRTVTTTGVRSPYLALPATYEELLSTVSRNLRGQVRRRRRSLEALGSVRLRTVREGPELDKALTDVLRLEGSGWKTRAGTAIVGDPARERLYRSFALAAAPQGWLRLHLLEVDGQPVAADYGCSFGQVGHLFKTGYDEGFEQYSPGLVLRAEVLRASIEEGLSAFDFLGGPDHYKVRWAPRIRPRTGIRAYRGPAAAAEYLYWRRCRPVLRSIALRTIYRSS